MKERFVRYYDSVFIDILEAYIPFHTKKTTGYYVELADTIGGSYIAQGARVPCHECKNKENAYPLYAVYSYKTLMYEKCTVCGHEYIDMSYYSNSTRELQKALARAYPSCLTALKKEEAIEKEAVKLWKKDRKSGKVKTNRVVGNNVFGPVYAKSANLFEMLEHYKQQKLPGHFIHDRRVQG